MPADSPTLPTKYTVFDIRGVTRGSSRPTVYFKDGSRFTQIHRKENNIGYHKSPHKNLLFKNIPESEMNSRKKRNDYRNAMQMHKDPKIRAPKTGERLRLFECKENSNGRIVTHISRSALEEKLTMKEKFELITQIRGRSTQKRQTQGEWHFV